MAPSDFRDFWRTSMHCISITIMLLLQSTMSAKLSLCLFQILQNHVIGLFHGVKDYLRLKTFFQTSGINLAVSVFIQQ